MAEYRSLLEELAQNITAEDLEQLKSACKEDIPSGEGEAIATSQHWFAFLEKHSKLDKGQRPPRTPAPLPVPSPGPCRPPSRSPDPLLPSPGSHPYPHTLFRPPPDPRSPIPAPLSHPLPRSLSPSPLPISWFPSLTSLDPLFSPPGPHLPIPVPKPFVPSPDP